MQRKTSVCSQGGWSCSFNAIVIGNVRRALSTPFWSFSELSGVTTDSLSWDVVKVCRSKAGLVVRI